MTSYRIYMLNPKGRVLTGADADCANDEAAFAWARTTLGDDARAEIWQGARCVGHISGAEFAAITLRPHSSVTPGQWLVSPGDTFAASAHTNTPA